MSSNSLPVRVVAGILRRGDTVLLCQRKRGSRYELLWEFPGGKCEAGESDEQTLHRELFEELSIVCTGASLLHSQETTYDDGGVFCVSFFLVNSWSGECINNVFEQFAWVPVSDISKYDLLSGNTGVVEVLHNSLKR